MSQKGLGRVKTALRGRCRSGILGAGGSGHDRSDQRLDPDDVHDPCQIIGRNRECQRNIELVWLTGRLMPDGFLKRLDAAYPAGTAIKLILDNHSTHMSKETRAWIDARPPGRFAFTFTPKHGSWLNLIEGFFSKFARSVLRHIRVTSKHELKERIMAGIDDVNRHPVIHTWSYKLAEAA
jgi:hypothetical protein